MIRVNPLRFVLLLVGISYTIKASNLRGSVGGSKNEKLIQFGSFQFYLYGGIAFFLACFAGVCSGLTIGYMSISKSQMQLWAASEDEQKRKMSKPILQILNDHHFLLSTLLLANALALEALPIFLDKIVPLYLAIIISTTAVVVFGQVLPQAFCTGHHKTAIGYYMSPFIRFLQFILYPFVKPIVIVLDKLIQHDQGKLVLTDDKIKSLLLLHNKKQYGYRPQEIQMLQNCLDLKLIKVSQVMIPLGQVFMLQANTKVNQQIVDQMLKQNYSKFPVYEGSKDKVIGFVKSKNLIQFNLQNPISFRQANVINTALQINANSNLLDVIDVLKSKKINFAIVVNNNRKCLGVITLKQIFDKIVLKKFKDNDIRVQIHLNKQVRIDSVMEAREQD